VAGVPSSSRSSAAGATGADAWVDDSGEVWTYASATTFTVPTDLTAKYTPGTRIKLTQSSTVKYFVVLSSTYSNPNTTVTAYGGTDYTLANAAISANYHSYAVNPQGYPTWFNFNANYTGFSSIGSSVAKFSMVGTIIFVRMFVTGTSNATTLTATLPIASPNTVDCPVVAIDNNVQQGSPGLAEIAFTSTTVNFYKNYSAGTWTASSTKSINGMIQYGL
jgi:hypothetical protein